MGHHDNHSHNHDAGGHDTGHAGHGHNTGHGHDTGSSGTGTILLTVLAVAAITYALGWASRPGLPLDKDVRENAGPGYFEPLPAKGPVNAPVVAVEVVDFKCGFCALRHGFVKRLMAEHRDVRFVVKLLPFVNPVESERSAIAAMAANRQGRFWDYADMLFRRQKESWTDEVLIEYAKELGLDPQRFRSDLRDPSLRSYVRRDKAAAEALDIRGTPSLFVNGRALSDEGFGRMDPVEFRDMVRDARKSVEARVAAGKDVTTARAADAEKNNERGGAFARLYMLNDALDLSVDLRAGGER